MTSTSRKTASRLDAGDYQAVAAFRRALRNFLAFSAASAEAAGLTSQQHQALLAIRAHDGEQPMTVSQLAESLLVRRHTAVELVDRLVVRDLVVRTPSEIDRRRVLLRLTPAADDLVEQITRNNLRELSSTEPVFRDLLKTLHRIGGKA